jgi:hypothetical protein
MTIWSSHWALGLTKAANNESTSVQNVYIQIWLRNTKLELSQNFLFITRQKALSKLHKTLD